MRGVEAPGRRRARTALWLLGLGSVALFAVLAALDLRMQREGARGIIDFELAGSVKGSRRILEAWGSEGRDAARLSLLVDYPFLVAYGAFWALACAGIRDVARRRGWRRLAALGPIAVVLPVAAAAFDAVEDVGLLLALGRHGGAVAPRLATVCAVIKFVLIEGAVLYVVVGLAHRFFERFPATRWPALAAAVLLIAGLVVNAVVTSGETEPAGAGDGRIVRLPHGDLHVIDQGPRRRSALVLIPGFSASTSWWGRDARILDRRYRVIRVDLLGHGGSEKPRSGYGLEDQARLIIQAVRKLGVRTALVAGHSLGGAVAVAMAERDRALVRGVTIIGTPPQKGFTGGPSANDLTFVPVLGQAIFRFVPDFVVKRTMQAGFADGREVPDRFVHDARRMTYNAAIRTARALHRFYDARPADERMAAAHRRLLVIFGTRDKVVDPKAAGAWDVPGARIVRLPGVGHSPQYERPRTTAHLILGLAGSALR